MFCPNCGKDCGSAKFCASCGTKVQQVVESKSQTSEWKIGMPCPHCGGLRLNGNHCAFCGVQLLLNSFASDASFEKNTNIEEYFDKYKTSRVKAIKALRKDTGMDLIHAKKMIDQLFDQCLGESHDKDLLVAGKNVKDALRSAKKKE